MTAWFSTIKNLPMRVKVKVPGSCGELVQGFFAGEPLLVTCPVEIFTRVTVSDEFSGVLGLGEKSLSMLAKTLEFLKAPDFKFGIKLVSELPRAKGMASSSADLAAVSKAAALALGRDISAEKISELAASIEPTDGIFFSGIAAMNPVTGKFVKNIRAAENFQIAIFDYGGTVDTLKFNRRSNFQIPALADALSFELVEASARANQQILYKKNLPEITAFAKNLGAVTVNAAHSGTVIGIFFRAGDEVDAKILEISRRFEFVKFVALTRLSGGGIYAEI
mgnify:CR=1 FL=1